MAREIHMKILGPYRVSHHPLCEEFNEHVYTIRGNKVCRGCVMQYTGMLTALVIITGGYLVNAWIGMDELQIGLLLYLMIFPTFLSAFVIENRLFKDAARFLLGCSFSIAFILLLFTPDWLIKAWIVINFIPGYYYLNKRREKKNREICRKCPEYSRMPDCPGYQKLADRERIFLSRMYSGGIKDPYSLPPDELD